MRPPSWRVVAIISLALNVLALGVVFGGRAAGVRLALDGPARAERVGPALRAALQDLPEADRAVMRKALRGAFFESRDLRIATVQARAELFREASKDAYDEAAVRDRFARMRAADTALQQHFHDTIATALSKLSPDSRKAALRAFAKRQRRFGREPQSEAASDAN